MPSAKSIIVTGLVALIVVAVANRIEPVRKLVQGA